MMVDQDILPAAVALGLSLIASPLALWLLGSVHLLDHPNWRSTHRDPTPRGGGIAIVLALSVGVALTSGLAPADAVALLVAIVGLGALGFADDLRSISVALRLGVQVGVAGIAVSLFLSDTSFGPLAFVAVASVLLLWLVGYVNAFNFMDGINGISSVTAAILGVALAVVGVMDDVSGLPALGLVIAGAAIGFLPVNFPSARVFLGDVGSYGLGAALAGAVIIGLIAGTPPEALLAGFVVYVADTSWTLGRRVRRGERWSQAHREHVYQRLVDAGWSGVQVVVLIGLVTVASALLGFVSLGDSTPLRAVADVAVLALVLGYLAAPSLVTRSAVARDRTAASQL